jgi:hypothetical protein
LRFPLCFDGAARAEVLAISLKSLGIRVDPPAAALDNPTRKGMGIGVDECG